MTMQPLFLRRILRLTIWLFCSSPSKNKDYRFWSDSSVALAIDSLFQPPPPAPNQFLGGSDSPCSIAQGPLWGGMSLATYVTSVCWPPMSRPGSALGPG